MADDNDVFLAAETTFIIAAAARNIADDAYCVCCATGCCVDHTQCWCTCSAADGHSILWLENRHKRSSLLSPPRSLCFHLCLSVCLSWTLGCPLTSY